MSELIDYYRVLRVPQDVDLVGIQTAYARLAQDFASRLDRDEMRREELKQLNEAFQVLADPELRREYDRVLFADEFHAVERQHKSELFRWQLNRWTATGIIALLVVAELIILATVGASGVTALLDGVVDLWGRFVDGAQWAWGLVEQANDALGNPIGWIFQIEKDLEQVS